MMTKCGLILNWSLNTNDIRNILAEHLPCWTIYALYLKLNMPGFMEISHKKGVYYLLFDCCFVNYCTVNALSSFQHANKPPVNGMNK